MIKVGQEYKALEDIEVICMTSWEAPFTGGYDRVLPLGEVFTIINDPQEHATAVCCRPENYEKLHKEFIPLSDRINLLY